ncbi:MAG TPA: hypothetical protein VE684_00365 [Crenalkalicoccus sp.]|jgi:hypothetical protein|nr:hypothetical protein [Crenalkalicoccus sp.]
MVAIARLTRLDQRLASDAAAAPGTPVALRARDSMLVASEALAQHADYFDAGEPG